MKTITVILIIVLTVGFGSCSQKGASTKEASSENTKKQETQPEIVEKKAVCIWDNLSVRETPMYTKKNYITSLSKGEKLTSLGLTAYDSTGKVEYVKVKLQDGTEGWSSHSFIVEDADPAVLVKETSIYKRPDLLTKTSNEFSTMDIIAIKDIDGDWVEVAGQRKDAKYFSEGWIKKGALSLDEIDIAMAKFLRKAEGIDDDEEKLKTIQDLVENSDFSSSNFMNTAKKILDEITDANVEKSEREESDSIN